MITISNLSKQYGKRTLFENISLTINQGERIGLVGPNGAGKTTLFELILGENEASSGSVHVNKGAHIGYLPQESSFKSDATVLSELTEGDQRILALKDEKAKLEDSGQADSKRYGDVLHSLETLGFFELEYKAKKILMGLGFKERDFNRKITAMSGGWQMRTLLAKLLTYHYDLLLLDEPTNYLDLNAALWLKDYLADFQGTFIMISHDRAFLTDVTNYTLILENGSVFKVHGNYEHYQRIKDEKRAHLTKQFKEQEKKREQLEKFVARFHAQPNKAAAVRSKRTALERLEKETVVVPEDARQSIGEFDFPQASRSGYNVLTLNEVSKSYSDTQVYNRLNFEILCGEKAVLAGDNGAGKSTLLKILAGVIDFDSGSRVVGYNVDIGYFSQTRMDVLNPDRTVLEEAYSAAPGFMREEALRTILGAFLFRGDDAHKRVSVLSGGEKSRLILAKLLINPPNFLLLDEPTTHLDVDAVEALVKALNAYQGTIVFISHDIYFVRCIANMVFEVKDGRVRKFPGEFDYYLKKKEEPVMQLEERDFKAKPKQDNIDKTKDKIKEEERLHREEDKKRKAHNIGLRQEINKLEKNKEDLRLESYAKARALSDSKFYRDEEMARSYGLRMKEIEEAIAQIDIKIKALEAKIISY